MSKVFPLVVIGQKFGIIPQMERRRKLSRREAVIAIAGFSAVGVGLVLKDKVSPYIKYLSSRNHENAFLDGEEIEQMIHTSHENSSVKANKTVFAEELKFIAKKENPEKGISWLHSFLRVYPLEIQFPQREAKPLVSKNGVIQQPRAGYTPALSDGPTFIFYPSFLQEYHRAKREIDVAAQIDNDMLIWHEIIHFWQDVRGPFKQIVTAGVYGSFEKVNNNRVIQPFDISADPFEKEAWEKASAIVETRFNYVVETRDFENWPFGNFFV